MASWRDVPLCGGPVEIRGALDLERRGSGVLPRRLPAWTRAQYPDAFTDFVASMPSGVRLVLRTDATALELELLTTVRHFDGAPEPGPAGVLDLLVDGVPFARAQAPLGNVLRLAHSRAQGRLLPGGAGTVRFAGLPGGMKELALWLPQQTPCELRTLRADGAVEPPGPARGRVWVHHGSSISHCTQADAPTGTWPVVAAARAGVEVVNLGMAGNCHLDPYVARTVRDSPADLISLELGANPVSRCTFRPRTFGPAVHGFLDTVRDGHPDTPLLVVSPVFSRTLEAEGGPAAGRAAGGDGSPAGDPGECAQDDLTMAFVRDALSSIVRSRARTDPALHYLDGRRLFGPRDAGDQPDGVHPNAAGYRRMGCRFASAVLGPGGALGPEDGHVSRTA
ncbi:GDSL-type esterase/lipase family protein [Streptomyces sp. NPDC020917]|uniref:GDSL-type esterase/lipase family protein n=1 Tax=Streptomyces sp. NPDC020917 TaxID=3365102 RepID=UPI0037A1375D